MEDSYMAVLFYIMYFVLQFLIHLTPFCDPGKVRRMLESLQNEALTYEKAQQLLDSLRSSEPSLQISAKCEDTDPEVGSVYHETSRAFVFEAWRDTSAAVSVRALRDYPVAGVKVSVECKYVDAATRDKAKEVAHQLLAECQAVQEAKYPSREARFHAWYKATLTLGSRVVPFARFGLQRLPHKQ